MGHNGLAKKFYTHFTSPIRRYADLLVHRTLFSLLRSATAGSRRYGTPELARIAEHISRTERVAADAEMESVELKKLEYFQSQLARGQCDEMDAVVCGVKNFGFFVELPESQVQGLVHISTLGDDFYVYDERRECFVGRRSRRAIRVGDRLRVRVEQVDLVKRQIDFRVETDR